MRRSSLVLYAALQLCRARQHSFSIHDDLLAYPQFEVVFSDTYISELDAQALMQNAQHPHPSYTATFASATDLINGIRASDAADSSSVSPASPATSSSSAHHGAPAEPAGKGDDGSARISETYEILRMGSESRYLCTIPVLAPPEALNSTATELAKAEEARELIRASERGWELMSGLDGACLYYVSGWWSYSFCYGRDIMQFHALPNAVGKAGMPVKDPDTQEYILGRTLPPDAASAQQQRQPPKQLAGHEEQQAGGPAGVAGGRTGEPPSTTTASPLTPPNTEVAIKDDQRYLVQRLDSGTLCDLTGRERTIEVQYHCNPNANNDRIGWIKEITTCSYLMVVNTPRLCEDVAFLPPKESRAHPIACRAIVSSDEEAEAWHHRKTLEAFEAMGVMGANPIGGERAARQPLPGQSPHHGMTIGGVVVGGRQVLALKENGEPVARLPVPRGYVSGQKPGSPLVEVLATAKSKAEGGEVVMLTDEELQKMELDPKIVEELYKQLQQYAGDKGWKLEVVEIPGQVAEIRGVIDPDSPDDEDYDEDEERVESARKRGGDKGDDGYTNNKKYRRKDHDGDDDGEGSEEKFFKEEL